MSEPRVSSAEIWFFISLSPLIPGGLAEHVGLSEGSVSPPSDALPPASVFVSFSFASRPSTRLSKASNTSVLGPLFLGTASEALVSR